MVCLGKNDNSGFGFVSEGLWKSKMISWRKRGQILGYNSWQIISKTCKTNWSKIGMIWLDIERYHTRIKTKSNFHNGQDSARFCWPNVLHYIYRRYPRQERGLTVVHNQEPNWKNSRKSGDPISILEANSSHSNDTNRLLDISRRDLNQLQAFSCLES